MKDEFLATVSHELRTPLNAVLGWVHLLRTGKLDRDMSSRGLETIERNVKLAGAAHRRSARSLEGADRRTATRVPADHDRRRGAAGRGGRRIRRAAKDVSLDLSIPDSPVVVLGDPTRLRQIVWHLLVERDQVHAARRHGQTAVTVEEGTKRLLTVTDSGPGIDPEFLPRIFDRFSQADSSLDACVGRAGRRPRARQAAGRTARRRNRGAQSRGRPGRDLHHSLARAAGRPAPAAVATPDIRPSARFAADSLQGLRVLVVDHDVEARELLRTVLHQRGAEVQTAASVSDALDSLEAWRPDVLVSDADSPQHDSYSLIGKIESLDTDLGGRIPALALTALGRSDPRLGRLIAEVHRDLPKPVEPALLTAEIARLAGRDRRHARP